MEHSPGNSQIKRQAKKGWRLFSVVFIASFSFTSTCCAQNTFDNYLQENHYSFSLTGFDNKTEAMLKKNLADYKLILLGEGGSHYLKFYNSLRLMWIKFLGDSLGLTRFFMEFGHSSDLLCNQYLKTGNTDWLNGQLSAKGNNFWENLYRYNLGRPDDKRIKCFGIDFERAYSYFKALKLILPPTKPPQTLNEFSSLIKVIHDPANTCNDVLSLNTELKEKLRNKRAELEIFFGAGFFDLQRIILNNGSCKDRMKNRNKEMYKNFMALDDRYKEKLYYGELGMAHTNLTIKSTAYYINHNEKFKNKVCVINTYCYNCSTPEEKVSNWQFSKVEGDIIKYLLPFCKSAFTLFDFSKDNKLIDRFRAYGQYLIIAKNQN